MAGLFPSIANSQNVDLNGVPLRNSVLTVYLGGTLTQAICYQDIGLAITAQNPMTADITGRLPVFYVADGVYRVRLVDQYGVEIYDYPQIASIGASSSGGGGTAVDPTTIFQTGDPLWVPINAARTGFVRLAGRTIGSATSGASERANADCQNLFLYNWNTFSNTLCPVLTGRGANAAADWAANKQLTVLDMRGRGPFGVVDMGNAALTGFDTLAFVAGGSPIIGGSSLGSSLQTITTPNLPPYTPTGANSKPVVRTIMRNRNDTALGVGGTDFVVNAGSQTNGTRDDDPAILVAAPVFSGNAQGGTSTPFDKMPPGMLGSWFQKL